MTGPGEKPVQNIPTSLEKYPDVSLKFGELEYLCERGDDGQWLCTYRDEYDQVWVIRPDAIFS